MRAMGMAGASPATVISRFAGMVTTLSFIHFHYHPLNFGYAGIGELFDWWRPILHIGIPGAAATAATAAPAAAAAIVRTVTIKDRSYADREVPR